ncbi:hypothetical protein ACQ86G_07095 [Roseateles chitinivorans]|uniref:hypothetical protein n=1 Tax=Roseateles chitinivorans TaxID=2917965 RepID=UPI003D679844
MSLRLPALRPAVLCVALLLTGCSSGQWLREGASPVDIDHDSFDCEREAARMYPPSITKDSQFGGSSSENKKCTKKGDTTECNTTTTPAYTRLIDANEGRRSQAQDSCMRGKGYHWRENR